MTTAPDKSTQEWGAQWARGLWDGLFSRFDPLIDGQVILDLGCSWGYTLKFFAEHFRPSRLIGVDISPLWESQNHGWEYHQLDELVEFHAGHFYEMDQIQPGVVDLIVSSSTFQYMTPEEVAASAAKAQEVLRPGGEAIIRTRTATSHIGSDLHSLFDLSYPHLLYGYPAIETVAAEAGRSLRYLNFLTASSYLATFMQAGFEVIDAARRPGRRGDERLVRRIEKLYPGVSEAELFCAELDLRLVKPIDPKDLPGLASG